jgi:hypothetical protein
VTRVLVEVTRTVWARPLVGLCGRYLHCGGLFFCDWDGVEGQGGVALFLHTRDVEGSVAGGQNRLLCVLDDDEGVRSERGSAAGAAQEAEGGFVLGCGVVGGVDVDDVDELAQLGEALEHGAGATVFKGEAMGDLEGGKVGTDCGNGLGGIFGEPDVESASAEGLDADGTGSGVEVDEAAAVEAGREDVKDCLAEMVTGGTNFGSTGSGEEAGAMGSGDDAHFPYGTGRDD